MKVSVSYSVEVDDHFRLALSHRFGRPHPATRKEVQSWFKSNGDSGTDDLLHDYDAYLREQVPRRREADWIFFLDNGFAARTECGWCGESKDCRGKRRSRMACHDCFVAKGEPPVIARVTA